MNPEPRLAFVIDSLPSLGGGEKVLFSALEAFPHAEVFTLVYNCDVFRNSPLAHRNVITSRLDALPLAHKVHRFLFPFMPSAIEKFDLRTFDTIVCFHYAVAHGVKKTNGARHMAYTFTPLRYAWTDVNINGTRTQKNIFIDRLLFNFRKWDRKAASRVHQFAAISQAVSQRIRRAYDREAPVIYPPVEVERFRPHPQRESYYITISRLVPYKRIDLLIQAFSKLGFPLLVIGDGPELGRLKGKAASNIKFLGYESDQKVAELLGKARAFVSAAEEDFGIAIVEAQAAGCPVITYGQGGALDMITECITGILFPGQSVASLLEAVRKFEATSSVYRPHILTENVRRFDKECFIREFRKFVDLDKGIKSNGGAERI